MNEIGDTFRALKEHKDRQKAECPRCPFVRPKAHPTRLMPGQRCKVCGYRDPRSREDQE